MFVTFHFFEKCLLEIISSIFWDVTCQGNNFKRKMQNRAFFDIIIAIIQGNYNPDRQIVVDESVISFKGRVSFRQYLKGKPNPCGLKAYVLSDSKTCYMHNLRLYYGKDTNLIDNHEASHTVEVVTTLTDHLRDKGYDLYTDRFYTSPLLADALDKWKLLSLVLFCQANEDYL